MVPKADLVQILPNGTLSVFALGRTASILARV